ncbi:hypothetical protein ATO6_14765 [Oceanicola sp. 22II-s10i]|uniref:DUF4386 domain-containing protein n=1 Tax=Oceanicola sp. 22II-s10i TaxID=1317116 RepID=UPI000B527753|nr:DUF4386 domain-containing protein [Oceanicola sp. 22II-s10i]OWU84364.1 hypothetical protein ATO6_14765 [Oceanicola sp. 22II-s10i]
MTYATQKDVSSRARRAGFLYLGIILCGITAEGILRGSLIDRSDAAATAQAIAAHIGLFRLSILLDAAMVAFDVALAMTFYRMLRGLAPRLILTATALRLIQAAMISGGLFTLFAAARAATSGGDPLPALNAHAMGYDLGLIFFGVNTLIMAHLLDRAGAPRPLAAGLAAAGLVYLTGSLTRIVAPEVNAIMQPAYLVPLIAETALMLWLILGARPRRAARG